MEQRRLLDELNERLKTLFAQSPAADLEKNLRAMLTSFFSRLDLVTREEFDVQREVLARTRAKLQELEAKLAELEKTGNREIGKSGDR
jgi:ubiquinone biosynthesis accessory factor UbiK